MDGLVDWWTAWGGNLIFLRNIHDDTVCPWSGRWFEIDSTLLNIFLFSLKTGQADLATLLSNLEMRVAEDGGRKYIIKIEKLEKEK